MTTEGISHKARGAAIAPLAGPQPVDKIEEIYGLVHYLKRAIDDIREKLTSARKPFYTVGEVAAIVGRSAFTVRRWLHEGRITATRLHGTGPRGRLLIARDQLDVLVSNGLASEVPDAVAGE